LITPFFSLKGELAEPQKIEKIDKGKYRIITNHGHVILELKKEAAALLVYAEVEKDEGFGKRASSLKVDFQGYERFLAFEFNLDPPNYFRYEKEPYEYPPGVEASEEIVSAWTYPWHVKNLGQLPEKLKVSQILFKGKGDHLFILSVVDGGFVSYLTDFRTEGFNIVSDAGVKHRWRRLLVAVITFGKDPYSLVENAYDIAFELTGRKYGLRKYKELPETFRYLGWCTWNAFWRDITHEKIIEGYKKIREHIPAAFVLIDDGWMDEKEGELRSFTANKDRFPGDLGETVRELKKLGARHVGLWLTLNGYWNGIGIDGEIFEKLGDTLEEIEGMIVPRPEESFKFFGEWFRKIARDGFSFVKVDNQVVVGLAYKEKYPWGVVAEKLHRGVEGAACSNNLEVLNCMAINPDHIYNWLSSKVARSCIDYIVPHRPSCDKLHIYFNAYNSIWMSQVIWPDWDMFQTHDPMALQQAVARAISGGPIYITDVPGKTVSEVARPLALSDGRIALLDAIAVPIEDVLFRDPYNEEVALKVYNTLTVPGIGKYGIVAVFNIHKDNIELEYSVSPADARLVGGRYLFFEYFTQKYGILGRDEKVQDRLLGRDVRLYVFVPEVKDIFLIGSPDIYIMPWIFERVYVEGDTIYVILREKNRILIYSETNILAENQMFEPGLIDFSPITPLLKIKIKS